MVDDDAPESAEEYDPAEAERIIQEAIDSSSLTDDEFVTYSEVQTAFENALMAQAEALRGGGDFAGAQGSYVMVRDTNIEFVRLTDRQIADVEARASNDDDDLEFVGQLRDWRQAGEQLVSLANGGAELMRGFSQRFQGDLPDAIDAFQLAIEEFETLAETPGAEVLAAGQAAIAAYNIDIARGLQELAGFNYSNAMSEFRAARAAIDKGLLPGAPIDRLATEAAGRNLVELDRISLTSALETTAFLSAVRDGQFDTAVEAARRVVRQGEVAAAKLQEAQVPEVTVRLHAMERGMNEGWLNYAEGELATDQQEWERASNHFERAREQWMDTAAAAISSGLPQARALSDRLHNMTATLLQSAMRRNRRERELHRRIRELEQQLAEARHVSIREVRGDVLGERNFTARDITNSPGISTGDNSPITQRVQINNAAASDVNVAELKAALEELYAALGQAGLPLPAQIDAQREAGAAVTDGVKDDQVQAEVVVGHLEQVGKTVEASRVAIQEGSKLWESVKRVAAVAGPMVGGGAAVVARWFGVLV